MAAWRTFNIHESFPKMVSWMKKGVLLRTDNWEEPKNGSSMALLRKTSFTEPLFLRLYDHILVLTFSFVHFLFFPSFFLYPFPFSSFFYPVFFILFIASSHFLPFFLLPFPFSLSFSHSFSFLFMFPFLFPVFPLQFTPIYSFPFSLFWHLKSLGWSVLLHMYEFNSKRRGRYDNNC